MYVCVCKYIHVYIERVRASEVVYRPTVAWSTMDETTSHQEGRQATSRGPGGA